MSKELELIARGLADAADDGCFDNPPNFDDPKNPPSFSELDEWHSGEEDREWWMKLAKSSVSKLSEHGYSIVHHRPTCAEAGDSCKHLPECVMAICVCGEEWPCPTLAAAAEEDQ